MRVIHYLNQFFGGLGGEEQAGLPLEARAGAVGPGRLLEQVLGHDAKVVATLICGDNYAAEHLEQVAAEIQEKVKETGADLFVAGPCFEAGRYGVAAGAFCSAVQSKLGIPVVTGMALENPGVDLYRQDLHIIDSGPNAAQMRDALTKMARLAVKLVQKEPIGSPAEEGYFLRGILHDEFVEKTAAERLIDMALAKAARRPFESELMVTTFEPVAAPPPVLDLSKATIAIVTDGGLVPRGNPDKIPFRAATNFGTYNIAGVQDLQGQDYEVSHRGYDTRYVEEDPNRLVPVDVLREMEKAGLIGKLHDQFLSTSGLANPFSNTRPMGKRIAEQLKDAGIDAVILTST